MKTFLLYPHGWVIFNNPPLGIAYLAAYMRQKGLDVDIFDATFSKSIDEVMDRIKKYNPDIVGFSLLTRLMRDVKELVRRIKKFKKEIIIVAGGPHAVALPEELINNYNFDIVVLGEGEKTMVNLVKTLDKGASLRNINGIVFKKNDLLCGLKSTVSS